MCSNFTSVQVGVKILFQNAFFTPCYLTVTTSTQKKFNKKGISKCVANITIIIIIDKCDFSTFFSKVCNNC